MWALLVVVIAETVYQSYNKSSITIKAIGKGVVSSGKYTSLTVITKNETFKIYSSGMIPSIRNENNVKIHNSIKINACYNGIVSNGFISDLRYITELTPVNCDK
jgi:hypothetical protein